MSNTAALIDCPGCGRYRRAHRGGRCERCYRAARTTLGECRICGERRPVRAGACARCTARRRARPGACARCKRTVRRLWAGRCSFCAKRTWTTGSCGDCLCWAASIAGGRCRACRHWSARHRAGVCCSCRRRLPVNRAGRCRLCVAVRRHDRQAGHDADGDELEPGRRPGIQLFFGDMPAVRQPRRPHAADVLPTGGQTYGQTDGQLALLEMRGDPRRADAAAQAWARTMQGVELTARLAEFAQACGWPQATAANTRRALELLAGTDPQLRLDAAIVAELRRRHLPPTRLREFLRDVGLDPQPVEASVPAALARVTDGLPAPMIAEVEAWTRLLVGATGRGRPHAAHTITNYLRALTPALGGWVGRYSSLRQVTAADIDAVLDPLAGSARTLTAVALRSLFVTLKANRMVFADPARRTRPGRFPRHPALGLDEATRTGLLVKLTRPDYRLTVLLAGVHALSNADIAALRVDDADLAHARLAVRGRRRHLDHGTARELTGWLDERRRRWPASANPHLLVS